MNLSYCVDLPVVSRFPVRHPPLEVGLHNSLLVVCCRIISKLTDDKHITPDATCSVKLQQISQITVNHLTFLVTHYSINNR